MEKTLKLRRGFKLMLTAQLLGVLSFAILIALESSAPSRIEPFLVERIIGIGILGAFVLAMALGMAALFYLYRGYREELGGGWPVWGTVVLFAAVALTAIAAAFSTTISLVATFAFLSAMGIFLGGYIAAFIIGAKELYDKYHVPEFKTAFILYILFFLVIPPIVATWLMYRGLGKITPSDRTPIPPQHHSTSTSSAWKVLPLALVAIILARVALGAAAGDKTALVVLIFLLVLLVISGIAAYLASGRRAEPQQGQSIS